MVFRGKSLEEKIKKMWRASEYHTTEKKNVRKVSSPYGKLKEKLGWGEKRDINLSVEKVDGGKQEAAHIDPGNKTEAPRFKKTKKQRERWWNNIVLKPLKMDILEHLLEWIW